MDFRHEVIGRGHAERLVPLIAELADGGRADAIFVGCGPGSFAGVRIGVAAARALALGWQVPAYGFSTLALVAAGAADTIAAADGALVVMEGGHGQWFVQPFAADLSPRADVRSLLPDAAVRLADTLVVGNRAEAFVERRGSGTAVPMLPDARAFAALPATAIFAGPSPAYGRAPDAKPMVASA
ncbi:tRNA (adenosine(37)-N6)-threonylcarbamoyltransferase complex dimerization subunit type 1 TsaB [Sphingopyxis sp. PET50]|uniref:tRNA (adenosine(37)-N6)-threonylcarbamoyltransferase complex dimerization subunit type 1 TsaB n=1 Tax=Sphingopyxis sp. PET50 TaxID=2976533 RepID=UPI00391C8E5E